MPDDLPLPVPTTSRGKEPVGPIIGAGIVVMLLIIGALYYWDSGVKHPRPQDQLPLITGENTNGPTQ